MFPVATVSIQNAVRHHEVGIATGAMNFFRALAWRFVVAIMGAILLAGLGCAGARRPRGLGDRATVCAAGGHDVAACSAGCSGGVDLLAISLVALVLMEERPLRGSVARRPTRRSGRCRRSRHCAPSAMPAMQCE